MALNLLLPDDPPDDLFVVNRSGWKISRSLDPPDDDYPRVPLLPPPMNGFHRLDIPEDSDDGGDDGGDNKQMDIDDSIKQGNLGETDGETGDETDGGSELVASMEDGYRLASALMDRARVRSARELSAQAAIGGSVAIHGVDVVREVGNQIGQRLNRMIRELQKPSESDKALGIERRVPRIVATAMEQGFLESALLLAPVDSLAPHLTLENEARLRQKISVQTRQHEERMLRTAVHSEPVCANRQRCQGLRIRCLGGGATLMAFWSEDVWRHYSKSPHSFEFPSRSQICLLCMRYEVFMNVAVLRATNSAYKNQLILCSSFCNLVNQPNEYRIEDCIGVTPFVFEGLLGNVVAFKTNCFERVDDRNSGCIRFLQHLPRPGVTTDLRSSF